MKQRNRIFALAVMFVMISVVFLSTPQTVKAGVNHEAFTIITPAENQSYPVNEALTVTVRADKFIETYINGFKASTHNYVILEILKDDVSKKTISLCFSTTSGMGVYAVGMNMTSTFTPTELVTYTVKVGFCRYDRGEKCVEVGYNKITDLNYLGSYTFKVVKASEIKDTTTDGGKAGKSTGTGTSTVSNVNTNAGTYTINNGSATFKAPKNTSVTKLTIPATIKANGKTVPVTAIAKNAFKGMDKLTTVTIGKNVKSIGAKAFYGCKKLKKITIKTTKLTKKTVGSKAFTGINKKAVVKCPKAKKAAYKKILLKKGMKKTVKFK